MHGRIRPSDLVPGVTRRWLFYLAFWTFWGLLNAGSALIENLREGGAVFWEPIVWELTSTYTLAVLCPLVVYFTLRYPFSRVELLPRVLAHFGAAVAFSLLHTGGMVGLRKLIYSWMGSRYVFEGAGLGWELLYEFYKDVRTYAILVALTLGFEYYNRYRERELESARLQQRLVEAQMRSLKGQLNPHFLFNSLHMISALVSTEPERAETMISRLSDLLRISLKSPDTDCVSLEEEVRATRLYLDLMEARFGDRVVVSLEVPADLEHLTVPPLLLQPLVENAFRHGLAEQKEGGTLRITAALDSTDLLLTVANSGPHPNQSLVEMLGQGLGLSNTEARLKTLFGGTAGLELCPSADGFCIRARVPQPGELPNQVVR